MTNKPNLEEIAKEFKAKKQRWDSTLANALLMYEDKAMTDRTMITLLQTYEEQTGIHPTSRWQKYMELKHPNINYKVK